MMGPYFDMLGETEPRNTKYTLTVRCPPRPPSRWVPAIFTPNPHKYNTNTPYRIRPSDYDVAKPNYDYFELRHLPDMPSKTVTLTSAYMQAEMCCDHIGKGRSCEEGCYVLEKGGDTSRWKCKREDCEGHVYCVHLYGINYNRTRKGDGKNPIIPTSNTFTLTALVAPVSMTGYPTFRADELHTLTESVTFHIDANEIPEDIRCSCLEGGRFCLSGAHWLLEYDIGSEFWLDEYGQPKTGALARYTGKKKGHRSVVINGHGERICCVEGSMKTREKMVSPTATVFTSIDSMFAM